MKKISIVQKSTGNVLDFSNFQDEASGLAWFQPKIDLGIYGKNEAPAQHSETGELVCEAVPAEFDLIVEDISSQVYQDKINEEALQFLGSTDWLIIRELETGVVCPEEIKEQRAEARLKVIR